MRGSSEPSAQERGSLARRNITSPTKNLSGWWYPRGYLHPHWNNVLERRPANNYFTSKMDPQITSVSSLASSFTPHPFLLPPSPTPPTALTHAGHRPQRRRPSLHALSTNLAVGGRRDRSGA